MLLQDKVTLAPSEYMEDISGAESPSIDLHAILAAALRRWKLIVTVTLFALIATYGVLKLVPSRYISTVEILVYDPQQQINAEVQKPIFPFVDAVSNDAMTTEIDLLKSKSVALRVASELGLDRDPEFQPHNRLAELAEELGFSNLGRTLRSSDRTVGDAEEEQAERLDQAADELLKSMQVWQQAYILFVTATSHSPIMAQRLASAIAKDYLTSQREARQEALQRVATWLKDRVDNLQARVLETEASIEKLKSENDIRDAEFNANREKQIGELNTQLMQARAEVGEKRARLDQVRSVIESNGDIQSIPELTASATLRELRQKQAALNSRAADLQNKLGPNHLQVIALRAELATINQQMNSETAHILGDMKNSYGIAVRQEQSLEASLQSLTAHANSESYVKLQQLQRVAGANRKLYDSYLAQYDDISERRTLQGATSRIISPATLPRSPGSPRRMLFYALGTVGGLGGGFFLAFLLEYFRPGVRTSAEIEQSYGQPVVGIIPLVPGRNIRGTSGNQPLNIMVDSPFSHLGEAVRGMRISLELASTGSKVILITSALPAEGKSTAAMLLAASSATSGKRTVLLDCDLHQHATSDALQNMHRPGLSELLRGTVELRDVLIKDPVTTAYVIPAGSMVPNAADLLMSQRMRDLIAALRKEFDYIVMDTAPLLPVVDALVLTTIADRVLVIVEWGQTPRASISEAFKVLRPEVHRVAGIVLNKVDLNQLPGYGYGRSYRYGYIGKYSSNGRNLTSTLDGAANATTASVKAPSGGPSV
jgi:succinoglycan biosynthesis transport protein ExoP